ncbi:MAG: MFS transporter [Bryobacteraceae bacterium]|jgi:MFS family permease
MQLPATLRALRYRNFRLFFSGQLISLIGTWMQNLAQAWLVYRLTGSSVLLGAVGFTGHIPVFLLSPVGGMAADRLNRRHVVIGTQTAAMLLAFALAALTLTGTVRIWQIFVLAALLGAVNAFDIPARQSFFVEMVGKTDLMNAIALNSSMFNASRVVGPAIAGILVASIGEGWCFFANAASYIAVIVGLLMMRLPPKQPAGAAASPFAHMAEGFRFVVRNAPVHSILVLLAFVSFTGMPYTVLMPIFADSILHGGPRALGWLLGATGVGALTGALRLASRTDVEGLGRWVAVYASGFGACLTAFALSRNVWLSGAILVLVGFCLMTQSGSSNTLLQSMVPDRLRGRVMSIYSMMFMGMAPFGSLAAGAAASKIGAPATVAAGGVICVAAAAVFWLRLPHFHAGASKLIAERQMSVEQA